MAGNKKSEAQESGEKTICRNRKALHDYVILDRLECGLVLTGTEVKSLRGGKASLEDAYARLVDGEVWLIAADIPEYAMGTHANHLPKRSRKLLLHRDEINKFAGKATQRGMTLIPLRLYFREGKAKVELAVAQGKKLHDKRDDLKKSEAAREMKRAMGRNRK
ncbi:MAG TPA: SsrA-binding protein SmpB [Gemmatales bacterium]|mgnify:CR=1 FL=1|nr:SsrA-binding protein SmpB [Gemmatales bacterium]HMP59689.1 SsrA-binding protein SmpB [Gemmatales bacterium]